MSAGEGEVDLVDGAGRRSEDGGRRARQYGAATSERRTPNRVLARLWSSAFAAASVGTLILYEALPGLNWGIWTTLVAGGLLLLLRAAGRPISRDVAVPAIMAIVLAWSAAATSSGWFHFWIMATVGTLLALTVFVAAGLPMRMVGAARLLLAAPVAAVYSFVEAVRRKAEAIGLISRGHPVQVVRGTILAVPVVLVFALLLSGADPVFNAGRVAVLRALESLAILDRLIVFGALGTATLGGYGLALRGGWQLRAEQARSLPRPLLGDTERAIVLGSVAALFAAFLLLQLAYLFGDLGAVRGSGVTYAEYARQGFGELTTAATLCAGLLVGVELWKSPGRREGLVRLLSLAIIVELHLLLESALRRVHLYESAYGYTTDRLYAQMYMAAVSAALLLLAWELWSGLDLRRLARRTAALVFACLLGLTVWNHEGWIAERNIERGERTGKLDMDYLGRALSLDAVPSIIAGMDVLTTEKQQELRAALHIAHHDPDARTARRWWEWNARRNSGVNALYAAGIPIHEKPPSPSSGRHTVSLKP